MKKADFWFSEKDAVRCTLCPHDCLIKEGQNGFCGVRGNRGGQLFALTYAKVVSWAFDPIEKKPLYHFYPGHKTLSIGGIGCNLRCRHCQNWQISCQDADENLDSLRTLSPQSVVKMALDHNCKSLVWTYNEPSIWYEYILDTAPLAQEAGLKTVMVTAGMLRAEPLKNLLPFIDAYRLDIKGFSSQFYHWLTGIDCLDQILENANSAKAAGCHLEIVTNLIPGQNDDELQLRGLARWIVQNLTPQTPWHLTAYFPNHQLHVAPTGRAALERGVEIAHEEGLTNVYIGNLPEHPSQHSSCSRCGEIVISRSGFEVLENKLVLGRCPVCREKFSSYHGDFVPE